MEISPTGCQAFATVIPVLLIAGFLNRRMLLMLVLRHAFLRVLWMLYTTYALVGMFVALFGASGSGLDGQLAGVVFGAMLIAAIVVVAEAAATMFQFETPLTEDELRVALGCRRSPAEEQSPEEEDAPREGHADGD